MTVHLDIDREGLAALFAERGYTRGAEIGTAGGEYAETLCAANPNLKLWCVDPWARHGNYHGMKAADLEACYIQAAERLAPYHATLLREYSHEAVIRFNPGDLDFVYIDANHELPYIMDDLCAWSARVREGGIVAGHDYHAMNDQCHVQHAVDCFVKAYHIRALYVLSDRYHSWFFEVKHG